MPNALIEVLEGVKGHRIAEMLTYILCLEQ